MKILITTDLFTTETNGVVTSVKNLRDELIKRGHSVRILTLAEGVHSYRIGDVFFIRSIPLGAVYPNVRMATSYHHRLIRQLVDWKPDVIHSQCEFFSFQFAQYIARHTGAPIVHTYHTLYEQYTTYLIPSEKLGSKAVGTLSRLRLKDVQRIIAPTYKVESVLHTYGLNVPVSVVPSGIDLEQHRRRLTPEERSAKRQSLGIGDDARVLLNIGRLGTEKNLEELLRFFADVLPQNENLVFLIVGDGPAREQLEQLAGKLGISGRVIFTGMVPQAKVQSYYQLGDVFVSASTSETQGLTYIEAAANGLPLLCREDLCLKGVLLQSENGYSYTNLDEFRSGLAAILGDNQWRQTAGARSEQIASAFSKDAFGAAVEQVYQSVLETAPLAQSQAI